jgi:hypothetical protein
MSKISELSDGGVIQGGDTLIAVRSGGNVKVTYGGSTTANIDGGTIDGTVIGGSTAAAGTFTTGQFNTSLNVDGTVTADGLTVDGSIATIQNTSDGTALRLSSTQNSTHSLTTPFGEVQFYSGDTSSPGAGVRASIGGYPFDTAASGGGVIKLQTSDSASLKTRLDISNNGDISFYEDTGTSPKLTWSASGETLSFADNAKAFFGAGSDLQIYHDGLNSYVKDAGTGYLILGGQDTGISLQNGSGQNLLLTGANAITLSYGSSAKLATTATGINVTGNVTATRLITTDGIQDAGSGGSESVFNNGQTTSNFRVATTGNANTLFVDGGSNNVGIAHTDFTNFSGKLVVADGSIGGSSFVDIHNNNNNQFVKIGINNNTALIAYDNADEIAFGQMADASGTSLATEHMRINSSGNVGIGDSSPSVKLDVYQSTVGVGVVDFRHVNGNRILINPSYNYYDAYNHIFRGLNGTYTHMTIDASGNVGIGTSSPTGAKLQVVAESGSNVLGVGTTTQGLFIKTTGTTVDYNSSGNSAGEHTFSTGNTERMRIDSSGRLLVNTTSQLGRVTVDNGGNTTGVYVLQSNSGINHVGINVKSSYVTGGQTGTMIKFIQASDATVGTISSTITATAYNTSSDQRLKENITDASSASDDIDAIQVRQFDWKADGSHQKYGMVAQELQSVAPIAVTGDADSDEMMGVDYSKLVPMMLKEIQSLRARVAQLEGAN